MNIPEKVQEIGPITMLNHELRTPLTISKEGVEILLDKLVGSINKDQEKLLFLVKNNLERLARAIEKVPDLIK